MAQSKFTGLCALRQLRCDAYCNWFGCGADICDSIWNDDVLRTPRIYSNSWIEHVNCRHSNIFPIPIRWNKCFGSGGQLTAKLSSNMALHIVAAVIKRAMERCYGQGLVIQQSTVNAIVWVSCTQDTDHYAKLRHFTAGHRHPVVHKLLSLSWFPIIISYQLQKHTKQAI